MITCIFKEFSIQIESHYDDLENFHNSMLKILRVHFNHDFTIFFDFLTSRTLHQRVHTKGQYSLYS